MMCPVTLTSPPRTVDVTAAFPELAGRDREAVRLHPRRGDPPATASSLGGTPWWPGSEPWPRCGGPHAYVDAEEPAAVAVDAPGPLVPVAQLWRRDLPELPFPPGTDVCQVLWCPRLHEPDHGPSVRVVWRDSATVAQALADLPEPGRAAPGFVPLPCTLSPERVVELPNWAELPVHLYDRLLAWGESRDVDYAAELSCAPGSKVGGWPDWNGGRPERMTCPAGHRMDVMLTVASDEYDADSQRAWQPLEEAGADLGGADTGLMLGDAGAVFIFVCVRCGDRPTASVIQG
jgi:hypothetical protein